jgi:hypothetical protein
MVNVITLSVVKQNVIMLIVFMLNFVIIGKAPKKVFFLSKNYCLADYEILKVGHNLSLKKFD